MAKGKLILICQSGGEFMTNEDGTLSYDGGEANAVNINQDTTFDDLKLKLAEMFNLDLGTISTKYFLPGNRRTPITLRNDKDLKRMIDFHGNSVTADLFVKGKEGFNRDAVKIHSNRENVIKMAESVEHVIAPSTVADPVSVAVKASHSNPAPNEANIPAPAPAPAPAKLVAEGDGTAAGSSPSRASTTSNPSSEHVADDDSDYKPRLVAPIDSAVQVPVDFDIGGSPADTVKKRRRTASWAVGSNGPTIVAVSDNAGGSRLRKRNNRSRSTGKISDDSGQQIGNVLRTDDIDGQSNAIASGVDLPEKLVASWKDCITGVGQDFGSVKEFREALQKYAVAHRFVYKLKKNDTNRASGICAAEGCSWKIHASWVPSSQSFRIKKFDNSHTCGGSFKNVHPAKHWLVSVIKDRLMESPHHKPREIVNSIARDFGIELNYTQVWRGMEDAREQLQGSYKESYNLLPWFCEKVVETNPGSFVKLTTNDDKKLVCLFVAFHASISGFISCRPILFLEATPLKSKYHETLLTATTLDADDGFFPVAFAIVDVENENNWHWFLEQLKSAITTSESITFVSDRQKELKKSLLQLFENAHHGYSMFHLMEEFKRNCKGPFQGEGKGVLPGNFVSAAHAVRLNEFRKYTEQIRQVSSNAYDWVIQLEADHWTSLLFKGERYNHITENVAESYNKLMEEVRESTIMHKIEALRCMMSEIISSRQSEASKWSTKLTPSNEKKIEEEAVKARNLRVFISSDILFEVHDESTHVVNIEKWECTCLQWKESGLPCCHAIAAFNITKKNVYNYCSKYFTVDSYKSTYSESINQIPGICAPPDKEESTDSNDVHVLPPSPSRIPSEQKKEQSKTEDPNKRTVTCSRCKEPGHNKASCKAII